MFIIVVLIKKTCKFL